MAKNEKHKFNKTRLKYGSYAAIITAVVIAIVIVINVLVGTLSDKYGLTLDMTRNQLFSLSADAQEYINNLDQDIVIYTTFEAGNGDTTIENALQKIQAASSRISIQNVDPIKNPSFAEQFNSDKATSIARGSLIVTNPEKTRFKVYSQDDLYETTIDYQTYQQKTSGLQVEQRIISALVYITNEDTPMIYLLQGHQEPKLSNLSTLRTSLEDNNYQVEELNLAESDVELKKGDTLMIVSPQIDLSEDERLKIEKFIVNEGGRVIMFRDTVIDAASLERFDSIAAMFDVTFNNDLVGEEDTGAYYNSPFYLVPTYGTHEITNKLSRDGRPAILPVSGSITLSDIERTDIETEVFLTSSANSYAKTDVANENMTTTREEGDPSGPFNLGVTSKRVDAMNDDNSAYFVGFASSSFVQSGDFLSMFGNQDLVLNSLSWMQTEKGSDITISSKSLGSSTLNITTQAQLYTLMAVSIITLPVILLVIGLTVYLRRRHL